MKLETFFENFELLTDAPNATVKLRQIVLQLAVQGKLLRQNRNDDPASVLLDKIKGEKQASRLPLFSINSRDYPYKAPQGWDWAHFSEVATIASNLVKPELYPDFAHIAPDNIEKETGKLLPYRTVSEDEVRSANHRFYSGQILYSKIRPNLAKVVIVYLDGLCSADMYPINAYIYPEYLLKYMLSSTFLSMAVKSDTRVAMPKINQTELNKILVAVPPLAEQKRIVEKCDRLLSICDEIEKRQQQRQESIVRMNESAIAQLLSSQNPDEFRQHWQRICNNFDLFYSVPETIPKLRQAILQLAVQGKLVRQDPNDEPAAILLERFGIEQKTPMSFELPYQITELWLWLDAELITNVIDPHPSHRTPPHVENGVPYIGMGDINEQLEIDFQRARKVSLEVFREHQDRYQLKIGDFIFGKIGTLGKPVKLTQPFNYTLSANVVLIQPIIEVINPNYLYLYMSSNVMNNMLYSSSRVTTHAAFGIKRIRKLPVPLPPLAEQKRIVEKCDRLMSLCDTLEAKLKQGRDNSEKLMEVAAKQILTA